MSSRSLAAATRDLLRVCHQARTRLRATDAALVADMSVAIGAAERALDDHHQLEMQDERRRQQIRDLAREARTEGLPVVAPRPSKKGVRL